MCVCLRVSVSVCVFKVFFLKLLWFVHRYVRVPVCASAPEGINNQWCDIYDVI